MKQLVREFQDLHQTTETVAGITTKFLKRALLVTHNAAEEEMKKAQYHNMLRADIREFSRFSSWQKLEEMISRACEQEIDLEQLGKRKVEQ